jgi:hypothetical protein
MCYHIQGKIWKPLYQLFEIFWRILPTMQGKYMLTIVRLGSVSEKQHYWLGKNIAGFIGQNKMM